MREIPLYVKNNKNLPNPPLEKTKTADIPDTAPDAYVVIKDKGEPFPETGDLILPKRMPAYNGLLFRIDCAIYDENKIPAALLASAVRDYADDDISPIYIGKTDPSYCPYCLESLPKRKGPAICPKCQGLLILKEAVLETENGIEDRNVIMPMAPGRPIYYALPEKSETNKSGTRLIIETGNGSQIPLTKENLESLLHLEDGSIKNLALETRIGNDSLTASSVPGKLDFTLKPESHPEK